MTLPANRITDPAAFGRVAVLMGGRTAEREISLKSGAAVLMALQSRAIEAVAIDAADDVIGQLQQGGFDRAFIALHGRGGEDGTLQGALEMINLPYTGSGVLGSALAMDKLRCKRLWQGVGLATPPYLQVNNATCFTDVERELGLPFIVKPAREGSSIGMARVDDETGFLMALEQAIVADDVVIAERWVSGPEYTVAILQGQALPVIRLETARDFYDFEAKYHSNDTRYHCPCGLSSETERYLQRLALKAFNAIDSTAWGRVDLMCDEQGTAWLLEVNTVPGMTDHSLVPMAGRAAGIAFDDLVWRILETSV